MGVSQRMPSKKRYVRKKHCLQFCFYLKCDTRLIGTFRDYLSIFPGWHMNTTHWLSAALDRTVENEKIKFLVDMSYELTK